MRYPHARYSGMFPGRATVDSPHNITRNCLHSVIPGNKTTGYLAFCKQSHREEHEKETVVTVFRKFDEPERCSCLVNRAELTKISRIPFRTLTYFAIRVECVPDSTAEETLKLLRSFHKFWWSAQNYFSLSPKL
jgi:hypothetical protein